MSIPNFDINYFRESYPMYSDISDTILTNLWTEVDVFGTPIISYLKPDKQTYYYYVVEAHLAELWKRGPGTNGIINSSTQGTVSASFTVEQTGSILWWNQTSWGAKIATLIKMLGGFRFISCGVVV